MFRIKRVIAAMSAVALIFAYSESVLAVREDRQVNSNRYTSPEISSERIESLMSVDGYDKLLENDALEFWYRDQVGSVRIVDKASGYVWGSFTEDKPSNMNKIWASFGNSILSLDYFDNRGLEKRTGVVGDDFTTTYRVEGNTAYFTSESTTLSIKLSFELKLEHDRILVSFDSSSVEETGEFFVGKVYVLPFLGSTQKDEIPGYMFVPDGCGALIRYSDISSYLKGFDRKVYGQDFGIDSTEILNDLKSMRANEVSPESPVLTGVYGIVHGVKQNALFANVMSGGEYASIVAYPSGVTTDYNWAAVKFTLRQKYQQPTSKSGAGIQVIQKHSNEVKGEVAFHFLNGDDADYVGMAKIYRTQLIEDGILSEQKKERGDIPLKVDFIIADKEKGLIFNNIKKITDFDFTMKVVEEIKSKGVTNLDVGLLGWQEGGISGQDKKKVLASFSGGSEKELKELQDAVSGKLSLYIDPLTAKEPQLDVRLNGSITLSQSPVRTVKENPYRFMEKTYYLNPHIVSDIVAQVGSFSKKHGFERISFDFISNLLFGHYLKNSEITRKQAMELYTESIAALDPALEYIGMTTPNDYMWKYTDGFYLMPMVSSQYLYENDTVPFLQIVLKGYMDLYAPYSNVDFFTKLDTLKQIDYGTYPSFLLTQEENHALHKTTVYEYNSTSYGNWNETICSIYEEINAVLREVEGASITSREVLSLGLVKVSYSNGKAVYVNYLQAAAEVDGITIPPSSALVKEGTGK